jgi:hypothetical protein
LTLVFVVCGVLSAVAQPDPGDIGIYMDQLGAEPTGVVKHFIPFDVYVLGFDLPGGVQGYEYSVHIPAFFTVLESVLLDGINVGADLNVIHGLAGCLDGTGVVQLQRLQMGVFVPGADQPSLADLSVCIGASTPSSLSALPSWLDCAGSLNAFGAAQNGGGRYPNGCLILNPTLPGCCPTHGYDFVIEDTLAPAGADVSVPVSFLEFIERPCPEPPSPSKTSCTSPYYTGLRFDLEFDPAVLSWQTVEGSFSGELLFTSTQTGPGAVHVEFGWSLDDTTLLSVARPPGEALARLGFKMAPTGGTARVLISGIVADNQWGSYSRTFSDTSFLVSDDPAVATERASFGSLKARY